MERLKPTTPSECFSEESSGDLTDSGREPEDHLELADNLVHKAIDFAVHRPLNTIRELRLAKVEGERVRSNILSVREIEQGLAAHTEIKDPKVRNSLAKAMAREVLGHFNNQKSYLNHGKRVSIVTDRYPFHNSETNSQDLIASPYNFWVKRTDAGIEFELIEKKLGTGATTTAFKTTKFEIGLKNPDHPMSQKSDVLLQSSLQVVGSAENARNLLAQHGFDEAKLKELKIDVRHKLDRTRQIGSETIVEATSTQLFAGDYGQLHRLLSEKQRQKIIGSTARALDALHQAGLVHRDVKPANIAIDNENQGHLADLDFLSEAGTYDDIKGTPRFADFFTCIGFVTELSDIYAHAMSTFLTSKDSVLQEKAQQVILANLRIYRVCRASISQESIRQFADQSMRETMTIFSTPNDVSNQEQKWVLLKIAKRIKKGLPIETTEIKQAFPAYQEYMQAAMATLAKTGT